jgi:hypothetical protein
MAGIRASGGEKQIFRHNPDRRRIRRYVAEIIQANTDWTSTTDIPKLFINGDPGAIVFGVSRDFCRT